MSEGTDVGSGDLRFERLLEVLRSHGFGIGIAEYVRVQQLIDGWQGALTPGQVRRLIAPLVSRSAEEQERFYGLFDEIYPLFATGTPAPEGPVPRPAPEEAPIVSEIPPTPPRRWGRVAVAAGLFVVISWGSGLVLMREGPVSDADITAGAEPPSDQASDAPPPALVAAAGEATGEGAAGTPVETPPTTTPDAEIETPAPDEVADGGAPAEAGEASPPPPPAPRLAIPDDRWLQLLALTLPLIAFGIFEWRARRRRTTVLESHRSRRSPISWQAFPGSVGETPFDSSEVREAARNLRRREPGESVSLSIPDTVHATIAARGLPTLRFRSHPRIPEYLALVERASPRDHQAHLFAALLGELVSEEVPTTTRYFASDPRFIASGEEDRGQVLSEVRGRLGRARLLVFSDGSGFLDPVTGRLESWVEGSIDWEHRALLTPTPPDRWGAREIELARHFVVVPATVEGVRSVFELFDPDTDSSGLRWETGKAGSRWVASSEPSAAELEERLTPGAFRWVCACAVYPELHWGLTLRLAQLPSLGEGVLEEQNLLELVRLPWFRSGRIPDGTRADLIGRLSADGEEDVRREVVRLLSSNRAPVGSVADEDQSIQLALQRFLSTNSDRAARRKARRELRRFPEEAVTRDVATAKVIERRTRSPLQLWLPETLRQRLYAGGLPLLGWRTATRVAAAGLVALLGLGMLQTADVAGGLLAAAADDLPDECAVFGPDYNLTGSCFDDPPLLLDSPLIPLAPGQAEPPAGTRLAIRVDANGVAGDMVVLGPSGAPQFDQLVLDQALAGAYRPAMKDGEPVEGWMEEAFQPDVSTAVATSDSLATPAAEGELVLNLAGVSLFPDETLALSSLLTAGDIEPGDVSWRSLSPDVARIDGSGRLVAIQPGQASLEASTPGGQRQAVVVNVMAAGITLSATELYLTPGDGQVIGVTSTASNQLLSGDRVTWTSSDPAVATVSVSGEVVAVDWGEAQVVASTPAGERTIAVTVHPPLRFLGGDPDPAETVLVPLGTEREFQAGLFTEDGVEVQTVPIEWAVEDSTVLAFDPVTRRAAGRAAGTTRLVARSRDGSVSAGWTVEVASVQVRASVRRIDLDYGETLLIPIQLPNGEPVPAGLRSGRWSSLDPDVASVSAEGAVTGFGWGRTSVVRADDGVLPDTVVVSVMPSGTYTFAATLEDETGRAGPNVAAGRIHFTPSADGVVATVEGCASQVITESDPFAFECGATLTFLLTPPFGIAGVATETVSGTSSGGSRTEIIRECVRRDPATGLCVEYQDRRREARLPAITWTTTRTGPLQIQRVP